MSRIYLSKADITEVEEHYILDPVRSGWVAPLGPHVDAFEVEIAARLAFRTPWHSRLALPRCTSVCSSSALDLALLSSCRA
jgi:dTDP-4-amino-4,6-dideoxygalactose transaminase